MITVQRTNSPFSQVNATATGSILLDVRYYKGNPWVCFSPFFPWKNIPIRFSFPDTAVSVAAMMEGLRVFNNTGNNASLFQSTSHKEILHNATSGSTIGFSQGIGSHIILTEEDAKKELLYPTYKWVLDYKMQNFIVYLREQAQSRDITILDYQKGTKGMELYTGDISIGELIKSYITGTAPYTDVFEFKEEHIYFTNYKRISGSRTVKTHIPGKISPLPCQKDSQLLLPLSW